jgi:hypothetical protein
MEKKILEAQSLKDFLGEGMLTQKYPDLFRKSLDRLFSKVTRFLDADKMKFLGIRNTMRLAHKYNQFLYRSYQKMREKKYEELLKEESSLGEIFRNPSIRMQDGWALDTRQTLPYLADVLREADEVIAERGNKQAPSEIYRSFFQEITTVADLARWPSFLKFITSPELLSIVCDYLRFVPALSKTRPTGVRFVESGKHLDTLAHLPPRDSQLYHIDFYATPVVYVIILLRDCAFEQGPFTFFSMSDSEQIYKKTKYWSRGKDYRLTDREVYDVLPETRKKELIYPRGTILFVDPSCCLHFGARNGDKPRFQMMYGLSPICRSDFSESYMPSFEYVIEENDPVLRKMVLDRRYL